MSVMPASLLACPRCATPLEQTQLEELRCPLDGLIFKQINNIWRMLLPEREPFYQKFIQEYETVRRAEGRGSTDPNYYRSLPYRDLNHNMSADWRIRRASFTTLLKHVVDPWEQRSRRPLTILDLGAGNGWLSNQLSQRGHAVAAVDLMTNDFDSLGCCIYYANLFSPIQAEFDHLPFKNGAADLVIFNASLHYSVDYQLTLGSALRTLAPGARLVVMDSPVYHQAASGAQMVQARESAFTQRFGFASNALPSENYLTYPRLDELAQAQGLRWQAFTPFYGLRWLLRPWKARLLGQREPAHFHLLVFTRLSDR
jgi:SAM-dependent methyltransferase